MRFVLGSLEGSCEEQEEAGRAEMLVKEARGPATWLGKALGWEAPEQSVTREVCVWQTQPRSVAMAGA